MRSIITSRRPSPALLLAVVALFVALGGTGYAAATMSGKLLKRHSVPANRLVSGSLTSRQIDESRLRIVPRAQAANTARQADSADTARRADAATTADTAKDAEKLDGNDASQFLANSVRVVTADTAPVPGLGTGGPADVAVSCPTGEKAIGGSGAWLIPGTKSPTALNAPVTASVPTPATGGTDTMTGWHVYGRNISGVSRILRAYVICVPKTV